MTSREHDHSFTDIVIVDDTPANLHVLAEILDEVGYRVRGFLDGAFALQSIAAALPDLILLDVKMPGMDGYTVCAQLKADEHTRQIPVIFISALDDIRNKVQGFAKGGVDYITKPFQAEEVLARVATHLTLHRLQQDLHEMNRTLEDRVAARTVALSKANAQLAKEIEERKQVEGVLRQSEERYRSLFENSPNSLWEEDFSHVKRYLDELRASGVSDFRTYFAQHPDAVIHCAGLVKVLDVNQATLTLVGVRDKAELLADFTKVLAAEALDVFREELVTLAEGGQVFESEEVHRTSRGEKRFIAVNLSVAPGYEQSLSRVLVSVHDITERKRAKAELEQRVAERTAELQTSFTALQQAQKQLVEAEKMAALGALVAGVAHEINTPLGNSLTTASYLESQIQEMAEHYTANTLTRSELDQYVHIAAESTGIILSNLNRTAHLIKSFKQVAVDRSTEKQRRFNLRGYLEDIVLCLRPHLKHTQHTVTLTCPEQLELTSYPGTFAQIISNLIMNSLIHGFEDVTQGTITIEVTLADASLTLIYRDNGKGIAADHLPKIFEPFFTTKRGQHSIGLGLHIVYNLVTQQLHGTITCESTPGQGTTFAITIPGVQANSPHPK